MTVKDLLEQEISCDVYDNVCEELAMAYEGEVYLTDLGKKVFADVLDYEVKLVEGQHGIINAIIDIDRNGEDGWQERLAKAKGLFESMAGYCTEEEWDAWFTAEV